MANPQLENGYTRIANEVLEAWSRTNFSAYQIRVLFTLLRKTYGFGKKADHIPVKQIVQMTGIHKSHVSRAIRELIDRNIVTKRGNKIGFNKDYTQWRELPKGATCHKVTPTGNTVTPTGNTVTPIGNKVTRRGNKKLPEGADSKEKKETISKETYSKESSPSNGGPPYEEIINYLNQKTGKNFSHKSKTTQGHINARWKQGFRLEAFQKVIDNRCAWWLPDPKMIQYLRPETLFGTKFESYLNDNPNPLTGIVSEKGMRTINNLESLDLK